MMLQHLLLLKQNDLLVFSSLYSPNICVCRSISCIFLSHLTQLLSMEKASKGAGSQDPPSGLEGDSALLACISSWLAGCEMNDVGEDPGLLGKPRHRFGALGCVYVEQRSSQAVGCLAPEISLSHYVIKPMQIIVLIFWFQNICREITFF